MDWFIRAKSDGFLDPVDITIVATGDHGSTMRRALHFGADGEPYITRPSHYSAVGVSLVLSHDDAVTLRNDLSAALGKPGDDAPSDPPPEVQPDEPPVELGVFGMTRVRIQDIPVGGYFEYEQLGKMRVFEMDNTTMTLPHQTPTEWCSASALGGTGMMMVPFGTIVQKMARSGRDSRGDSTFVYV